MTAFKTAFKVKEMPCPNCGHHLSKASSAYEVDLFGPQANDLSVCSYCCSMLIFDLDLSVRLLSSDEFKQLPQETQDQLNNSIKMIVDSRQ